jgi:hypothetical protein
LIPDQGQYLIGQKEQNQMLTQLTEAERRAAFEVVTRHWTPEVAARLRTALLKGRALSAEEMEMVREAAKTEKSRVTSLDNAAALDTLLTR